MPLFQPTAIFRGVEHITPQYLKENGITALILDVDNTLTGHGSQVLPERCRCTYNAGGMFGFY